jgi:hypothetical protein
MKQMGLPKECQWKLSHLDDSDLGTLLQITRDLKPYGVVLKLRCNVRDNEWTVDKSAAPKLLQVGRRARLLRVAFKTVARCASRCHAVPCSAMLCRKQTSPARPQTWTLTFTHAAFLRTRQGRAEVRDGDVHRRPHQDRGGQGVYVRRGWEGGGSNGL